MWVIVPKWHSFAHCLVEQVRIYRVLADDPDKAGEFWVVIHPKKLATVLLFYGTMFWNQSTGA